MCGTPARVDVHASTASVTSLRASRRAGAQACRRHAAQSPTSGTQAPRTAPGPSRCRTRRRQQRRHPQGASAGRAWLDSCTGRARCTAARQQRGGPCGDGGGARPSGQLSQPLGRCGGQRRRAVGAPRAGAGGHGRVHGHTRDGPPAPTPRAQRAHRGRQPVGHDPQRGAGRGGSATHERHQLAGPHPALLAAGAGRGNRRTHRGGGQDRGGL